MQTSQVGTLKQKLLQQDKVRILDIFVKNAAIKDRLEGMLIADESVDKENVEPQTDE